MINFRLGIITMAAYNAFTDQELTHLLKRGDQLAFAEIFNRYDRLLFIYAYKKLEDKEEARSDQE